MRKARHRGSGNNDEVNTDEEEKGEEEGEGGEMSA